MSKHKERKEKTARSNGRDFKYLEVAFYALIGFILIWLIFEAIELENFRRVFGNVSDFLKAMFTAGAVVFAYKAWNISNRQWILSNKQFMNHIIADLMEQYRSPEMGMAVRRLYEEYEINCGKDQSRLIERYVELYSSEKDYSNSFHLQRRMVSNFYQYMGVLKGKNIITEEKVIFALWDTEDLKIIRNILMPIEKTALPLSLGIEVLTDENMTESLKLMEELYEAAVNYKKPTP